MDDATPPLIDRALMSRDLDALATLLAPAIEARLAFLREIPVIGESLHRRLQGSPRAMTSDALRKVLDLTDEDLTALVDLIGRELGAWRGFNEGLSDLELAAAAGPYARLADALSDG